VTEGDALRAAKKSSANQAIEAHGRRVSQEAASRCCAKLECSVSSLGVSKYVRSSHIPSMPRGRPEIVQLSIPINISRGGERRGSTRSVIQTNVCYNHRAINSSFRSVIFCLCCLWNRGCQGKKRDRGPTFVPSFFGYYYVALILKCL
jgi:hypothetical protein